MSSFDVLLDPQYNALADTPHAFERHVDPAEYEADLTEWARASQARRGVVEVIAPGGAAATPPDPCAKLSQLALIEPAKGFLGDQKTAVAYLEERMAWVNLGGKAMIATRGPSGVTFWDKTNVCNFFASLTCEVYTGKDKEGQPKYEVKPAVPIFLASESARRYDGTDCDPTCQADANTFNTWEGIDTQPAPGDVTKYKAFLRDHLCGGSDHLFKRLWQRDAHMLQKPGEKPGFACVIIGPRGIGKSTYCRFKRQIVGRRHSRKVSKKKHLFGDFNAHQEGVLYFLGEEVVWGGDKQDEGVLKDMITDDMQMTERKFGDAIETRSFTRYDFVSNEVYVVPAGEDERRWFVLTASDPVGHVEGTDADRKAARKVFFDELNDWFEAGGREAIVHDLLQTDISDFDRFAAPVTRGLLSQVELSLSEGDRWLYDAVCEGQFTMRDGEAVGEAWELGDKLVIHSAELVRSYESHVRRYGGSSAGGAQVRRVLEAFFPVVRTRLSEAGGARPWAYVIPPRRELRERFERRFGLTFEADG